MALNWRISHVETIDSTMNWARNRVLAGAPDGTVIIADSQSGGRGRRGNEWQSPVGNLYMTFIVKPDEEQMRALPFLCALALHRAMNHEQVKLKWPNDILFQGRKLGGILIEREGNAALCGLGVNVTYAPDGGAKKEEFASAIKPSLLVRHILQAFTPLYEDPGNWQLNWMDRAAFLQETITFSHGDKKLCGVFEGIDDNGHALIRDEDGNLKSYASGEVREVRHVTSH